VSVSAGHYPTIGLTSDGRAFIWGEGDVSPRGARWYREPWPVAPNHTFVAASAGGPLHGRRTNSEQTVPWGVSWAGQLGDGNREARWEPAPMAGDYSSSPLAPGGPTPWG